MIKVGLTGNIGSGKTTVAEVFRKLGVQVYHADAEAKKFLSDKDVIRQIRDWWGDDVICRKEIDRKKLAQLVFSDPEKLAMLNGLIHPLVKDDLKKWFSKHTKDHYVIQEAAILFESGFDKEFDKVITVVCPEDIAMRRIMARDGIDQVQFNFRKRNQWDQEIKMEKSDFIIVNDDKAMLIPQVLQIHSDLLRNQMKAGLKP